MTIINIDGKDIVQCSLEDLGEELERLSVIFVKDLENYEQNSSKFPDAYMHTHSHVTDDKLIMVTTKVRKLEE